MIYCISLPQFEAYVPVSKETFFGLVDMLSLTYTVHKDKNEPFTHYFIEKSERSYEYLGCVFDKQEVLKYMGVF